MSVLAQFFIKNIDLNQEEKNILSNFAVQYERAKTLVTPNRSVFEQSSTHGLLSTMSLFNKIIDRESTIEVSTNIKHP